MVFIFFNINKQRGQKGFTLLEMLVVLSVVSIMLSISMFQFRKLSQKGNLVGVAYDTALFVRQAQTFGISSSDFDPLFDDPEAVQAVGVSFDHGAGGYSNSINIFRDVTGDNVYDSDDDVSLDRMRFSTGVIISAICPASSSDCGEATFTEDISVLFQRPEPSPRIYKGGTLYTESIAIELMDAFNETEQFIVIETSGNLRVTESL